MIGVGGTPPRWCDGAGWSLYETTPVLQSTHYSTCTCTKFGSYSILFGSTPVRYWSSRDILQYNTTRSQYTSDDRAACRPISPNPTQKNRGGSVPGTDHVNNNITWFTTSSWHEVRREAHLIGWHLASMYGSCLSSIHVNVYSCIP